MPNHAVVEDTVCALLEHRNKSSPFTYGPKQLETIYNDSIRSIPVVEEAFPTLGGGVEGVALLRALEPGEALDWLMREPDGLSDEDVVWRSRVSYEDALRILRMAGHEAPGEECDPHHLDDDELKAAAERVHETLCQVTMDAIDKGPRAAAARRELSEMSVTYGLRALSNVHSILRVEALSFPWTQFEEDGDVRETETY